MSKNDITEIITITVYTYEKLSEENSKDLHRILWEWFKYHNIEPNSIQID